MVRGMTTTARVQAGRLADLLRRERAEIRLSKGAAHYRKTAAGLVRRFPEIVEPLRDGRLCITSVVEVAKVLTAENRHEVLPRFFQRSRRDAMALAVGAAALGGAASRRRHRGNGSGSSGVGAAAGCRGGRGGSTG